MTSEWLSAFSYLNADVVINLAMSRDRRNHFWRKAINMEDVELSKRRIKKSTRRGKTRQNFTLPIPGHKTAVNIP